MRRRLVQTTLIVKWGSQTKDIDVFVMLVLVANFAKVSKELSFCEHSKSLTLSA